MAIKKKNEKVACTYHVDPTAFDNFEDYVAAIKKYARKNNLPAVDKGQIMSQLMSALKVDKASMQNFFSSL